MNILIPALAAILALGMGSQDAKQDAKKTAITDADKAVIANQLPSYPLTTCAISGEELGSMGDTIDLVHEGRLIRLCCKGCVKGVRKDPAAAVATINAAVIRAQAPSYPLKTCVLSGEPMEKPVDVVIGTRLLRTCCKKCAASVRKNPAEHIATVNKALIAAQKDSYPLTTCAVSGEELGSMGEPIDVLYGTTLVRVCCKGCVKKVRKNGAKIVASIKAASAKGQKVKNGK